MPKTQNKMGVMPIKKLLLTMAIPLMLSLVVQSLYNIVDSIFVARLSERALTATSLAYPVQILMIALSVGTGVGINALISRLLGAGRRDEVGKAAATGIVLALISSALFMVAGLIGAQKIARALTANEEIAELCGYGDELYFMRLFRKKTGMSARTYRLGQPAEKKG